MPPVKAKGGKFSSPPKCSSLATYKFPKHKEISKESHKSSESAVKKLIGKQLDIEALYPKVKSDQPPKKTMLSLAKPN